VGGGRKLRHVHTDLSYQTPSGHPIDPRYRHPASNGRPEFWFLVANVFQTLIDDRDLCNQEPPLYEQPLKQKAMVIPHFAF
jgi:hypothetical protein